MPRFLSSCPVAICDRCNFKYQHDALVKDGNSPGLMVCESCRDVYNPWRLPPIKPDRVALKWSRPDVPLVAGNVGYPDLTNPINPVPPNVPVIGVELEDGTGYVLLEDGTGVVLTEDSP
jgi:hypothetical protein